MEFFNFMQKKEGIGLGKEECEWYVDGKGEDGTGDLEKWSGRERVCRVTGCR